MSSTILTGKKAAAFRHPGNGKVIYALFEQTYESNVSPKTPHWSGIALGEYADVMVRVFAHAAACSSGALCSRVGGIIPGNYIESWKRELKKPAHLSDRQLILPIPDEARMEKAKQALVRAGLESQFERLDSEPFQLYADADVILALFGPRAPFPSWLILDHSDVLTLPDISLGPAANGYLGNTNAEAPAVIAYQLDTENLLVKIGDAPFHHAGWTYRAVESYITDVAYDLEMQQAGSAKAAIQSFHKALDAAPEMPAGVRVVIHRDKGANDYVRSAEEKLAKVAGGSADAERFECALIAFKQPESQQALRALARTQVEWIVPRKAEFFRPTGCYF